jgi:hypothetical protein
MLLLRLLMLLLMLLKFRMPLASSGTQTWPQHKDGEAGLAGAGLQPRPAATLLLLLLLRRVTQQRVTHTALVH